MNSPLKHNKTRSLIKAFQDPEAKPTSQILKELITLLWTNKEIPSHYFTYYMFKKGMTNVKDFLPNKISANVPSRLHDNRLKEVLDNKLYFDLFYKQFSSFPF